jgi:hypothetical protein
MPTEETNHEGEKKQSNMSYEVEKQTPQSPLSSRIETSSAAIDEQSKALLPPKQSSDHQAQNKVQTAVESSQETASLQDRSTSDTVLNSMPTTSSVDKEQKTSVHINNDELKSLQSENRIDEFHEKSSEDDYQSSALLRTNMFQGDLEIIRPEMTINGKFNIVYSMIVFQLVNIDEIENKALHFEFSYNTAVLLYNSPLLTDPTRDVNTLLIDKTVEFINSPQYEKTKAQRVLAKPLSSNTTRPQIEGHTIETSSSSTNLAIKNAETILVSFYHLTKKLSVFS